MLFIYFNPMENALTFDVLTRALKNIAPSIPDIAVKQNAFNLLSLLGYDGSIPDNFLDTNERIFFYELEDLGLLTRYEDKVTIPILDGKRNEQREWRIYYWEINRHKLYQIANNNSIKKEEDESIYKTLDNKVWAAHEASMILQANGQTPK